MKKILLLIYPKFGTQKHKVNKMDKNKKIEELKARKGKYTTMLKKKSLALGEADGAMISRFPTGRFELEQELEGIQVILNEIQQEITALEK